MIALMCPRTGLGVVFLGDAVRPGGRTEIGGWTDLVWMPEIALTVTPEMPRLIICSDYALRICIYENVDAQGYAEIRPIAILCI